MRHLHTATPGRHLMVLDDAETIARQARRRAVEARRRREALMLGAFGSLVLAAAALILGASVQVVGFTVVLLVILGGLGYQRVHERHEVQRRHAARAHTGRGIGAPRPKGAFSTIRHRSGEPVWVDRSVA